MSTASETTATAAAPGRKVRPFYWSIRRELWENRAIFVAPLAVAAVILLAFLFASHSLAREVRIANGLAVSPPPHPPTSGGRRLDPAEAASFALVLPYFASAFAMIATTVAVGVFYLLGSLYGERRDRTVLFWKSLPVSDLTTVLSKAVTPVVILALVTFAIAVGTQSIMLLVSTAVLLGSGPSATMLWSHGFS
jgi:ABC-2 type transport system permease protein